MKMFFWLTILGFVVFLMYQRVQVYGYPWQTQVVITNYDTNKRYRGGSEQLYVFGEVQNRTKRRVSASIECKTLPAGMTLTPKSTKTIELNPEESIPFDMELRSRQNATGAECKVGEWSAGDGLEARLVRGVQGLYNRIRF